MAKIILLEELLGKLKLELGGAGLKNYEIRVKTLPRGERYSVLFSDASDSICVIVEDVNNRRTARDEHILSPTSQQREETFGPLAHPLDLKRKFLEGEIFRLLGRKGVDDHSEDIFPIRKFSPRMWVGDAKKIKQARCLFEDADGCFIPLADKPVNIGEYLLNAELSASLPFDKYYATGRTNAECRLMAKYEERFGGKVSGWIAENGCLFIRRQKGKKDEIHIHPAIDDKIVSQLKATEKILKGFGKGIIQPGKRFCVSYWVAEGFTSAQVEPEIIKLLRKAGIGEEIRRSITHTAAAVDITPPGINKETGLLFACEILRVNPKNTIVVGDAKGDAGMMRAAMRCGGLSAAPANVTDDIGIKPDYISPWPEQKGVRDIHRQIALPSKK